MQLTMRSEFLLAVHVLLALSVDVSCEEDRLHLELASVLYRHGDRSPLYTFPNDRYKEDDWPQGYGQLSVEGMRQEYHLGTILKERYITDHYQGFLYENYTRLEVYIRSTDYDRTLMSAESQLAGLFPPKGDQIFDPSIPWQPIPVHTVPKEDDTLLKHAGCKERYDELWAATKNSESFKSVDKENEDFFTRVENCTGLAMVNLSSIYQIQDVIYVEKVNGYETPSCLNDSDFTRMTDLSTFTLSLRFDTLEKQRITAGNLTEKVLIDMKGKAYGDEAYKDSKVFLYSAHDTTVTYMMSAMGVWDYKLPEYAAAFIIELLKNNNTGEYFVEMYHRANTSTDEITLLPIPACGNETRCTLEEFESFTSTLIPEDWQAECGFESRHSEDKFKAMAIAFGVLWGVFFLLWIVTCGFCVHKITVMKKYEQIA